MESTQIQTSTKTSSESTSNNCKTAQNLTSSNLTNNSSTSSNSSTNNLTNNVNSSTAQIVNAGEQQTVNTINNNQKLTTIPAQQQSTAITPTNVTAANLITSATLPIGQQTTTVQPQQIIQVSSQAAIVPGQQLMVQTLAGRPSIQLRTQGGQQFQQIQLIPFSNLQGQNQRPVIIQQTPGNVIHSATGTITSMANLTQNNIAKLNNSTTNALPNATTNLNSHQKPVIIQQQTTATGQFIHSANAQAIHNVTKIATVGRATNRTQANSTSKMVLGHLTNSATPVNSSNINHQTSNHLVQANAATLTNNQVVNSANPQQVTRLNIISSIPGVHTSVAQHTGTAKPIINLTALNKPLILNPATSVVQPSIVGNVVNMSNFTNAHQLKQSNATNILPTVMTLATLTASSNSISTGRHTMIASSNINHSQFNNSNNNTNNNLNLTQQQQQQQQIVSSASNATQHNQQQQSQQTNINQTLINHQSQLSTMRSNLLNSTNNNSSSTNTLNSPIKQISQQTPSSPRPSILIRKRVGPTLDLESKTNFQSSLSTNNSQINSVKQNLSLKYNNSLVNNSSSSINQLSSTNNNLKNAQDLLNKQQQGVLNLKKQNLDNNNSQLIKNENEQLIPLSINQQSQHNQSNKSIDNLMNSTNELTNQNNQITPRKRRKQLLEPFMLTSSQNIKLLNEDSNSTTNLLCNEDLLLKKKDNQQLNCHQTTSAINRKNRPSLLSAYNMTWKSLQYHFLRHTEVKIKNEKKANLLDLTNDNLKNRNSWKINHLSKNLEDILENEILFNKKLKELSKLYDENKDNLPSKIKEIGSKPFNAKVCHNSITILDKLNDLFAANIQRSNLIHDQIKDTNSLLNKLSNDHNEKINKMTKRFLNKRSSSVKV